ncbi:hypothetical protein K443DRAFT_550349, partial [Laccaria amethystina LaAM-08-1]
KSQRLLEGDLGETIQAWVIDGSAADSLKAWEWSQVAMGAHNSVSVGNIIPALTFQIRQAKLSESTQAKLRDDIKCASKQCLRSSLSSHIDRPDLNFDIFLHSRLARLFALTLNVEKYLGHRQWTRLPPLRSFSPSLCLQLLRLRRMQTRVWRLPTLSTTDRDSMLGALLHDYCVYDLFCG